MLREAVGGGRVSDFLKKALIFYEDVRFKVISFTTGWMGVEFPEKKRCT